MTNRRTAEADASVTADDAASPDIKQTPDAQGNVVMHHPGLKVEAPVRPQSLDSWGEQGWKPGPLSS